MKTKDVAKTKKARTKAVKTEAPAAEVKTNEAVVAEAAAPETKKCTRCEIEKDIDQFRLRPFGFRLNQCKQCEGEMNKARREAKKAMVNPVISITTKSGVVVEAYSKPIEGCRVAASPNTDKVLYFDGKTSRDTARVAFSTYANVSRTGITYKAV